MWDKCMQLQGRGAYLAIKLEVCASQKLLVGGAL